MIHHLALKENSSSSYHAHYQVDGNSIGSNSVSDHDDLGHERLL